MAQTSWNITIPDTSPLFQYFPYADGSTIGWTGVWSDEGKTAVDGSVVGEGLSQHITPGESQAVIKFNGTAIYLQGGVVGNMRYSVTLDGVAHPGSLSKGTLASFDKLSDTEHTLILQAQPQNSGDWLGLQSAIVTVGCGLTGASVANLIKDQDDAAWNWSSGFTDVLDDSTGKVYSIKRSSRANDIATLTFTGHSVFLNGPTNVNHGRYSVTVDGRTDTYNGTSRALVPSTVLYHKSGLDPLKTHVLTLTNLDNRPLEIDYASLITIQGGKQFDPSSAESGLSTSSTGQVNIGLIVGAVLGGVIVLTAILLFFWWRQRKNRKASVEEGKATGPTGALPPVMSETNAGILAKPKPRVRFGDDPELGNGVLSTVSDIGMPSPSRAPPGLRRAESNDSATSTSPLLGNAPVTLSMGLPPRGSNTSTPLGSTTSTPIVRRPTMGLPSNPRAMRLEASPLPPPRKPLTPEPMTGSAPESPLEPAVEPAFYLGPAVGPVFEPRPEPVSEPVARSPSPILSPAATTSTISPARPPRPPQPLVLPDIPSAEMDTLFSPGTDSNVGKRTSVLMSDVGTIDTIIKPASQFLITNPDPISDSSIDASLPNPFEDPLPKPPVQISEEPITTSEALDVVQKMEVAEDAGSAINAAGANAIDYATAENALDLTMPVEPDSKEDKTRMDLLAALDADAKVPNLSRSGTRKVGLPSNPRAAFGGN